MCRHLVLPAYVLTMIIAVYASGQIFPTMIPAPTSCMYIDTFCNTDPTRCPPSPTLCPPVATQCPENITVCPALVTLCVFPATVCPPVNTECPVTATSCPEVDTQCPEVSTTCPLVTTQCPVWSCGPVPSVISYQGKLLGSANRPVTGVKLMCFEFYNAAEGGQRVNDFSEEQSVAVTSGIFNVLVGSATVGGVPSNTFNPTDVFLSVKVEGDELLPRRRVAAVPFALRASESDNAEKLDGQGAAAFAGASHAHSDLYYSKAEVDAMIAAMQAKIDALLGP